jgi:predicted nuclease of predicted toxin-antitoxin system
VPSPKLHLDEHLSPRLAVQLRMHGFDVTSTREMGMLSDNDEVQLAFAAAEQRALVTCNHKDFAVLHQRYLDESKEHYGIILSTEETISTLRRRFLRLLNTLTAAELKNQMRWLNEFK